MFRAAFPNASEADEKLEIQWVKDNYDLSGNNGSTRDPHIIRLAGTWVDPQLAIELGKVYSLGSLVNVVVEAVPDPNGHYRRSGKATQTTTTTTTTVVVQNPKVVTKPPSAAKTLPTPSPTSANPPAAKRRKDASPAPSQTGTSSSKPPSRVSPPQTRSPAATRRSTRKSKSPAPRTMIPLTSVRTPKRDTKVEQLTTTTTTTPAKSEVTAVDEEGQLVEDGVAGTELMEEDIKAQKALLEDLARQRAEPGMDTSEQAPISKKREREEGEPLKFEFKEPETQERAIVTNSRVNRFNLEPRTKSFAWGVAAFAVGMGAV